MFPDYSTLKTYLCLSNLYATLDDTTKITIEGIGTAVYTLNRKNALTRNALHILALRGPLYSLRKHFQLPGCVLYSSHKDGSYMLFHEFILQVEDLYNNIVSYRYLGWSHQCPIEYIDTKSAWSTNRDTHSGRPSMVNHPDNPESPHIWSEPPLHITKDIQLIPLPLTEDPKTKPSDEALHEDSV